MPQLARNHYFTGKLLVERDFTDEQRYNAGKQQRQNRYLHGSGTVCGLKVKQHPHENRRDTCIVIEPGTAIDCCGRELLVRCEEYFDFSTKIKEKKGNLEPGEHTLQICLRYSECPAEQVPVLFDECGSGGTDSQPNRIIEGYDFDVRIDPKMKRQALDDVCLEWEHTLNLDRTSRFAVDEAKHCLYILTSDNPSTLYAYDTDKRSLMGSHTFTTEAMDLALSRDGTRAYVSVRQRSSVLVLNTVALREGEPDLLVNELPAHHEPSGDVRLAVSHRDGHLYVLDTDGRHVTPWRNGINHKSHDVDDFREPEIHVGHDPHSIVGSPDGKWMFVANSGDRSVRVIDTVSHEHGPIILHLGETIPTELAVADTPGGLKLYVADSVNKAVSIISLALHESPPFTVSGHPIKFANDEPVDIAAAPGGRWLYVLLKNAAGKGRIQVIDTRLVEPGEQYAMGASIPIGNEPCQLKLVHTHQRLYAGFRGTSRDTDHGGVAIVHIYEKTCEDLLKRALEECPDCDDDCVILATIRHYEDGQKIADSRIDNWTDRHLLPSTERITDIVRCILESGGIKGPRGEEGPQGPRGEEGPQGPRGEEGSQGPRGEEGRQGPHGEEGSQGPRGEEGSQGPRGEEGRQGPRGEEGPQGPRGQVGPQGPRGEEGQIGPRGEEGSPGRDGAGIDEVQATIVDCDDPGSADIREINGKRTLVLEIPRGCDAPSPTTVEYTQICGISWEHGGSMERDDFEDKGLLIAFNHNIRAGDINWHTFQVLASSKEEHGLRCWCELPYEHVRGVQLELEEGQEDTCEIVRIEQWDPDHDAFVNGAWFKPAEVHLGPLRVILKGDFIRDENGRGVDANHLPPWLPDRLSGDGVEGGTFESWFSVREEEKRS